MEEKSNELELSELKKSNTPNSNRAKKRSFKSLDKKLRKEFIRHETNFINSKRINLGEDRKKGRKESLLRNNLQN